MKKWITKSKYTVYQVLEGRSNSFLVSNGNNYILVDTGRKSSWKELRRKLDHILDEKKLSCLILTHTHFDHAENAAGIKERYKARIMVQKSEAEYLGRGDGPLARGTILPTRFMVNLLGKRLQSRYKYEPTHPDILVGEEYHLDHLGFNAYVIHTPGHSSGSMSVIVDNEIALVGDAMFGVFTGSVFPPFADDPEVMVNSWEKLFKTGCSLFMPAHGTENSRNLVQKQYDTYRNR